MLGGKETPSGASADADALLKALRQKYSALRTVGWQRREARRASDRAKLVAAEEGRREWYHTVQRGEALASVARMFNTTPEAAKPAEKGAKTEPAKAEPAKP